MVVRLGDSIGVETEAYNDLVNMVENCDENIPIVGDNVVIIGNGPRDGNKNVVENCGSAIDDEIDNGDDDEIVIDEDTDVIDDNNVVNDGFVEDE